MNGESTKETMQSRHPKFLLQAFLPQFPPDQVRFAPTWHALTKERFPSPFGAEDSCCDCCRLALCVGWRFQETATDTDNSELWLVTVPHIYTQIKATAFDQSVSDYKKKTSAPRSLVLP